jgi:GTP-binding protein EngB required for normal cell division
MPQFILIGKQSVGKSRLIEALAGEQFNFISGTLGSRRPTVLEFRNVAGAGASRWFVRDKTTNQWDEHTVSEVMQIVGNAHEELGESVSAEPTYVRIESPGCVDMQIVDLPGFRDFSIDDTKKALSKQIEELDMSFMRDPKNVMLCVEQCGDAAGMATLSKCKELDPTFKRTILIRNKLDKYYSDLETNNINQWVDGYGDIPESLVRFAMTLPFWQDGQPPPKPFVELREEKAAEDVRILQSKGLKAEYLGTIGFKSFANYMEKKIEQLFNDAIQPVLDNLKELKLSNNKKQESLKTEFEETDPNSIQNTTRACGESFAGALNMVMEGSLNVRVGRMDLPTELRAFHEHHQKLGSTHFVMLPSEDFAGLDDYVEYLTKEIRLGAHDAEVNGGAQFRRVMGEVEIFLRFSEIAVETKKRDVIQARGVSMSSLTWRDVVVKLLSNEAHLPLQRRVQYVGERIKWFFEIQKEVVIDFMSSLEGNPSANMYSPMYIKHVKLMKQNAMIKHLIFTAYDNAVDRQLNQFIDLFSNMLTSTFSNPWVFLKGATVDQAVDDSEQTDEDTKFRIPQEIQSRSGIESTLSKWLQDIPTDAKNIDEAVDKVQMLVLKTYSFIRSQVCDQVELFTESFFKLPMLRRLNEDMSDIVIDAQNHANYVARRQTLEKQVEDTKNGITEINWCIERLQTYKLKCESGGLRR